VLLVNAWPRDVDPSGFTLNYDNAQLGKFRVTFRYDRFNLFIPPDYKVI
jgi:hypothetical protein